MKNVTVRELAKNTSKILKDLPVEITNRGVPIAWLVEPGEELTDSEKGPKDFVKKAIAEKREKRVAPGTVCRHLARPGECKITWCPNASK